MEYQKSSGIEDPLAIERKLHICSECDHFVRIQNKCKLCNCNVIAKAALIKSNCIIDKWSSVWIGIE